MYCAPGVKPYHSGLKPLPTLFALVTLGNMSDAELHELAIGLNTADLVSQP